MPIIAASITSSPVAIWATSSTSSWRSRLPSDRCGLTTTNLLSARTAAMSPSRPISSLCSPSSEPLELQVLRDQVAAEVQELERRVLPAARDQLAPLDRALAHLGLARQALQGPEVIQDLLVQLAQAAQLVLLDREVLPGAPAPRVRLEQLAQLVSARLGLRGLAWLGQLDHPAAWAALVLLERQVLPDGLAQTVRLAHQVHKARQVLREAAVLLEPLAR